MSGDTLFNTSDIVAEVAVVEKSLDKLSQQIRALNTAKVDAIQAELKKLGSSASTGVQEMAASIKSALDSALQLQKDYASGSLNITKREYATRLEEAKTTIATTALLEKQGFRSLLDDRKVYLAEKANLEKLAGIEAKRQALEQSLIANSQTPNSARDLVLNTKYAKDLENAKLEILENGASATLRAVERRERAILQMLQTGGDGALAIAQKKYGTDFVSVVKAGLDKEAQVVVRHGEELARLNSARVAAAESEALANAAKASAKAATINAGGDYSNASTGRLFRIRNAELFMNMPSKEDYLAATAKAAADAEAASVAARAAVKAATINAGGDYSNASTGRLFRIRNADLFMNMPSKEDYLIAIAKAAEDAKNATALAVAAVKAATINATGDYSSVASGRLFRIKNAELLMNMPSKEDYLAALAARTADIGNTGRRLGNNEVVGRYSSFDALRSAPLPDLKSKIDEVSGMSAAFKRLAIDGNDVHSMARGLASGFNALWLTWGNLVPLFIGAGISMGFMKTAKTGMEVANTLTTIAVLGENTSQEMASLQQELLNMSNNGPKGPKEVADAMKTLSLAGLKANEIIAVTKDTLNFSIAGTTDLKTAADVLVSVSTAFGMGSAGFSRVGDVISKAAAESKSSVESFGNAMKTASVIGSQYGVSLVDTATGIAALSQLGIEGTAAGTALRNMYADLSGRSVQVAKVLKAQGIEMRDAVTGNMRPMIEVVGELNAKLGSLGAIDQKNLLQAVLSERGAKGMIEMLRLINTEGVNGGKGMSNMLADMRQKIDESYGFAAISAAKMAQTVKSQFEAVKATLESSMVQAYEKMAPAMSLIADETKKLFASPEFISGLSSIVTNVAQFGLSLVKLTAFISEHAGVLALAGLAYFAVTKLVIAKSAAVVVQSAATAVDTAVTLANTAATVGNSAAKAGMLASVAGIARWIPGVGTAISLVAGAWMLYDFWANKSKDTALAASTLYTDNVVKSLEDEARRLRDLNNLRATGLSLSQAQMVIDGQKKRSEALDPMAEAVNSSIRNESKEREYLNNLQSQGSSKYTENAISIQTAAVNAAATATRDAKAAELGAIARVSKAQAEVVAEGKRQTEILDKENQARQAKFQSGNGVFSMLKDKPDAKSMAEFGNVKLGIDAIQARYKALADETNQAAKAEEKLQKFYYDAGVINYDRYQSTLTAIQATAYSDRSSQLEAQISELEAGKAKLVAAAAKNEKKAGALAPELEKADAGISQLRTSLQALNDENLERLNNAILQSLKGIIASNRGSEALLANLKAVTQEEVSKLAVKNDISNLDEKSVYMHEREEFIQEGVLEVAKRYNTAIREKIVLLGQAEKAGTFKAKDDKNADGSPTAAALAAQANYDQLLDEIRNYGQAAIEEEKKIAAARATAFDDKQLKALLDPNKAKLFGEGLKDAFDKGGESLGKLIDTFKSFSASQLKLADIEKSIGEDAGLTEEQRYSKLSKLEALKVDASVKGYGDMAGAAKGLFAENTAGYKLLDGIEKGSHALQMANTAQKLVTKLFATGAETAAIVTGDAVTAASGVASDAVQIPGAVALASAKAVGAVANQGGGDPYTAFPRIAAMIATMAGIGLVVGSAGGGGGGGSIPSSKERQASQGRGTVLGDAEAVSTSLSDALENTQDNTFEQLKYSSGMLDALKSIQRSMAGVAQIIFRTGGITSGNPFNSQLGTPNGQNPNPLLDKLGAPKLEDVLFGKISRSITDSGIGINGRLSELIKGQGFSQYVDVETTKKSFFGLVKKTTSSTQSRALEGDAAEQLGGVFRGISDSLQIATTSFGADAQVIGTQLANSVISIPTVSLRGLKGAELQEALNAVFSGAADKLASTVAPGFEALQQVGEGYYETVIRASTALMTVNGQLERFQFRVLGISTAGAFAAASLAELFGGINELNDASQQFYEDYYSDAERAAQSVKDMTQALSTVNLALPNSKEELRALASTLDLNTDAGRKAYTILLTIAPQFAKTAETVAQSSKDIAASILKALTGNGTLVPALDAVRLNALRLKDTLITGVTIGLTGAQEAAGFLSAEIEDLRDGAARATIDMVGLSTALAKADTATFVSAIALVFENLADRIKGVVNKVADERIAVRTAALQIMNPGAMNKDAIGRGIAAEQPSLVAGTRAADAAKAALLIAQAGLQRADARVDADRAALAASSAQPVSRVALEAAAAALAAAGPALRAQLAPQFTTEGTPGHFAYNGSSDAEYQQTYYMSGTAPSVNQAELEAAVAAAMLPYQDTYNQKIAEFNAATAKLATGVASSSVALNTTLQQQAAAVAVAKDRQLAYTAALQGFTIDAGRSVTRLGNLREETLKYYEAQKQLADLMGNSAKGLRESARQTRMGQLDSTQSLTQKRADFDKNYSLALSTTGETQVGYADKLAAALPELSTAMMDVATTRQEWAVSVASAMAKSEKIAALLEANAPKDFAADSLNMLRQIDIALIGIDATSKSAEKSITDAVTAGSSKIADGLRAVIAAVTGGPIPAFATGGAFTNGVVSRPTMFNMGVMGEAGSEAIMPLTNIGGQLGVRAISNGGGRDNARLEALVEKLTQKVAELSSETKAIALYTFKTADILKSVTPDRDAIATRVAV